MKDPETVGIGLSAEVLDPLMERQKHDVSTMRKLLLSADISDANSVRTAMNNIVVMRVYHQIARIIKFTEQMDKIEAKLYDSIDASLDSMLESDPQTLVLLLNIQERLQKSMIDSHKLLEPYLNIKDLNYVEISSETSSDSFVKSLLDQDSREKLREGAQAVLNAIQSTESDQQNDVTNSGGDSNV